MTDTSLKPDGPGYAQEDWGEVSDNPKLTPEEQRSRFIEAAREAGASEDEADFDAALKRIAKPVGQAR